MKTTKTPPNLKAAKPLTDFEGFVSAIAQVPKAEVDELMRRAKATGNTQKRGRKPKTPGS